MLGGLASGLSLTLMRFTVEQSIAPDEGSPFDLLCRLGALNFDDHGHPFRVWKVEVTDAGKALITYEPFADPEIIFG